MAEGVAFQTVYVQGRTPLGSGAAHWVQYLTCGSEPRWIELQF